MAYRGIRLPGLAVCALCLVACGGGDNATPQDAKGSSGATHDDMSQFGSAGAGGTEDTVPAGPNVVATGGSEAVAQGGGSSGGLSSGGTGGPGGPGTGGEAVGGAGEAGQAGTKPGDAGKAGTSSGGGAGEAVGGTGGQATGGSAGQGLGGTDQGVFRAPFDRDPTGGVSIISGDPLNPNELVIATDARGHVFLAGASQDPQVMGLTQFGEGFDSEAFAAKLTPAGAVVWAVPLLACGEPKEIVVDGDGAPYVVCPYMPDSSYVMSSAYSDEGWVAKLDPADGSFKYETVISKSGGSFYPQALAVDAQATAYAAGIFKPSDVVNAERALVVQISADGQQSWDWNPDAPAEDNVATASDVVVSSDGDLVLGGYFNHWLEFDGQRIESQAYYEQWSSYNGFVARIDPSDRSASGQRLGGPVFDLVWALEAGANGRVLVAGVVSDAAEVGGVQVTADTEVGSPFVAQLDTQGEADWVRVIAGQGGAYDVAVGPAGTVLFVGDFAEGVLLYAYDPESETLSSHSIASGEVTRTTGVAAAPDGSVWLSGYYTGTVDFGGGELNSESYSAFLLRIDL